MTLTINDLHDRIAQGENANTEFKSELSESVLRDLPTRICAFANSQGGIMIFGVTNSKDPIGVELKGDERERISQASEKCRPSISIDFEQVPFGKRNFLVVKVQRSRIVHSDPDQKFPIRIGSITSYLDAPGLMALIEERALLGRAAEGISLPSSEERRREHIPEELKVSIIKLLESDRPEVRIQVLMDLSNMAYQHSILESDKIASGIEKSLGSELDEEKRLATELLRSISYSGTEIEKERLTKWLPSISNTAKTTSNTALARSSFEILLSSGNSATKEVLEYWIDKADEKFYNELQPSGMLVNAGHYGVKQLIREGLYALLVRMDDPCRRKRIEGALEVLRRSSG